MDDSNSTTDPIQAQKQIFTSKYARFCSRINVALHSVTAIPQDIHGTPLTADQVNKLIKQLRAYVESSNAGASPDELVEQDASVYVMELYGYPGGDIPFIYQPDLEDIREVGKQDVVYFISSPMQPDQIKIGYTSDLVSRLGQLKREIGSPYPLTVHAFATVKNNQRMEAALHLEFSSVWLWGEWFQANPVLKFLEEASRSHQPSDDNSFWEPL